VVLNSRGGATERSPFTRPQPMPGSSVAGGSRPAVGVPTRILPMPAAPQEDGEPFVPPAPRPPATVTAVEWESSGLQPRLILTVNGPINPHLQLMDGRWRLVVDLKGAAFETGVALPPVATPGVTGLRIGQFTPDTARVVVDLERPATWQLLPGGDGRVVIELNLSSPNTITLPPLPAPGRTRPTVSRTRPRPTKNWREVVVGLDAGHGGGDCGARGHGLEEATITLDVATRLKTLLENAGVQVRMTRTTQVKLPTATRTRFVQSPGIDVFMSIHCNAFKSAWRGLEVYYHGKAPCCREFASTVQETVAAALASSGLPNRGIRRDTNVYNSGFYVLRNSRVPAVLVEMAYITNPNDAALLRSADFRQQMAQALREGLLRYLGARDEEIIALR
jgi:N-acetylmuramoyl-L-alanine amidase